MASHQQLELLFSLFVISPTRKKCSKKTKSLLRETNQPIRTNTSSDETQHNNNNDSCTEHHDQANSGSAPPQNQSTHRITPNVQLPILHAVHSSVFSRSTHSTTNINNYTNIIQSSRIERYYSQSTTAIFHKSTIWTTATATTESLYWQHEIFSKATLALPLFITIDSKGGTRYFSDVNNNNKF